jgi:hypothetical protein
MFDQLRRFAPALLITAAATLFFGCAAPPKPPLTGLIPGREVETLQSPVSISVKSADRSFGGRGFLIFKRPDRFHLAILSPFGQTLVDIYSDGDRFTCVVPARQTAYSGTIAELPERDGLKAWGLMRWVLERAPVAGPALVREHVNGAGIRDRLSYDNRGLLERKETEAGDRVDYLDYRNVEGVPFPESIVLTSSPDDTVRVVFEEPEVNRPIQDAVLTPGLVGIVALPFSDFKGF